MSLYEKLLAGDEKIAVVGLGYVGMPLAVSFAKKISVLGFDVNEDKVALYKSGIDPTNEVGDNEISKSLVEFTSNARKLHEAKFIIIAVPTPINIDKTPDLCPVESASKIVGKNLSKGSIVVYESTVYPGVTEDLCVPILEQESGLKCGVDFKIGYSPERINPSDKIHRLENIKKIVSGMDKESLDEIAKIYEVIIKAGVHRASSIKVAEAAKVVENSQRDINIAFMNELAMVFNRMDIDTKEVIEAMNTKWNALKFYPGLVGGHCIGVDPYYFIYEAEKLGYHSQIILSGRKINDGMGEFVANEVIKKLVQSNIIVKQAKVVIFGITFKENCPDIRNSKVIDIITRLKEYGIDVDVVDPHASYEETMHEYGVELADVTEIIDADCLIFAVPHDEFKNIDLDSLKTFYSDNIANKILIDVKGIYNRLEAENKGYIYWSL